MAIKELNINLVNPNAIKMEFMVLTPLMLRARQIEKEIEQVKNSCDEFNASKM